MLFFTICVISVLFTKLQTYPHTWQVRWLSGGYARTQFQFSGFLGTDNIGLSNTLAFILFLLFKSLHFTIIRLSVISFLKLVQLLAMVIQIFPMRRRGYDRSTWELRLPTKFFVLHGNANVQIFAGRGLSCTSLLVDNSDYSCF